MKTKLVILFLLLGLHSLTNIGFAQTKQGDVAMEQIEGNDKLLSQGCVYYTHISTFSNHSVNNRLSENQLFFSKDEHFRRTEHFMGDQKKLVTIERLYDGQDEYLNLPNSSEVQVSVFDSALAEVEANTDMAPGSCFPMGRGLSHLQHKVIVASTSGVTLTGTASDGVHVEAVLDTQHGYIAKQILRLQDNRLIGRWVLRKPVCFNNGVFIASNADWYTGSKKGGTRHDSFHISYAKFFQPDAETFRPQWQKTGTKIVDARLGQELAVFNAGELTHNYGPGISSTKLLAISRRVILERAELHAKNKEYRKDYERQQQLKPVTRWFIIAITASTIIGVIVVTIRRTQSARIN